MEVSKKELVFLFFFVTQTTADVVEWAYRSSKENELLH